MESKYETPVNRDSWFVVDGGELYRMFDEFRISRNGKNVSYKDGGSIAIFKMLERRGQYYLIETIFGLTKAYIDQYKYVVGKDANGEIIMFGDGVMRKVWESWKHCIVMEKLANYRCGFSFRCD
jgi:hypothetical protein